MISLLILLIWSTPVAFVATLPSLPHGYLNRVDAISILGKWKPQVVGDSLVSLTGVSAYTRARIALENDLSSGGIVSPSMDLFVASFENNPRMTRLLVVMWSSPEAPKTERFRDLRRWYDAEFPDSCVSGDSIEEDEDRTLWELSDFDA